MSYSEGIIHAYRIDGKGGAEALKEDDLSQAVADNTLTWVHLDVAVSATRDWLQKELTFLDGIIVDALLAEETRPRITEFKDGALMILRGVNLNENAEPEDMISIRMWVDQYRIISIRRRPLRAVKDIHERLMSGKGPTNSGQFITMLAGSLFERMEPVFQGLDERLDNTEERVMEVPEIEDRQEITMIRKQAIIFRRYIAPQRDVIAHLRVSELPWLDQTHRRRLQEIHDRVVRYTEDLDMIRERAQIIKEELTSTLSDKLNKNMYLLSVIAAIFLPLGFLTGLLGINVGGIPGAENNHSFWIFCGMLIVLIGIQTLLFKKLKWF